MFDGVALPFGDAPLDGTSSASEEVRWMAFARDLVLQELRSTPSTAQAWADATARSQEAQRGHYRTYRDFVNHMQERLPCHMGVGSPSPISGAVRPIAGRYRCGLLDRVEVAAPPATLVTDGMTQMVVSQASLDGVFLEALLGQELNLALWRSCGAPQEALQCALEEMQRLDQAACEEDAALRYLNTTRFAEQRTYKRRRAELQSQLQKTREKVFALEKLVRVETAGSSPREVGAGERLRACLLE
ncbi:hypothetical protein CGC21_20040 [Leishmania donovani]|uniref:Uncharacterized protein n=1 Tax=Leishmania donovani TaxID=5661 RepID=A0A504X911_LEIDO|nr:hypothetical protein CGC21_20040 [Leishmania donovani]